MSQTSVALLFDKRIERLEPLLAAGWLPNRFIEEEDVNDMVGDVQDEDWPFTLGVEPFVVSHCGGDLPSFLRISSDFSGFFIKGGGCFLTTKGFENAFSPLRSSSIRAIVEATWLPLAVVSMLLLSDSFKSDVFLAEVNELEDVDEDDWVISLRWT